MGSASLPGPSLSTGKSAVDDAQSSLVRLAITRTIEYLAEADRILHVCMRGLDHISRSPALVKALIDLDRLDLRNRGFDEVEAGKRLEQVNEEARFAEAEASAGFPILHAHAVVSLWSALEHGVQELLVARLAEDPGLLREEAIGRVKLSLAEYLAMEADDRLRYLVSEIDRQEQTQRPQSERGGVGRFEPVLNRFGLGGCLDEPHKRCLFELSHVRHVIVHRGGVADVRFVNSCPWVKVPAGNRIVVSHGDYVRYRTATDSYFAALVMRIVGEMKRAKVSFTNTAGDSATASSLCVRNSEGPTAAPIPSPPGERADAGTAGLHKDEDRGRG